MPDPVYPVCQCILYPTSQSGSRSSVKLVSRKVEIWMCGVEQALYMLTSSVPRIYSNVQSIYRIATFWKESCLCRCLKRAVKGSILRPQGNESSGSEIESTICDAFVIGSITLRSLLTDKNNVFKIFDCLIRTDSREGGEGARSRADSMSIVILRT